MICMYVNGFGIQVWYVCRGCNAYTRTCAGMCTYPLSVILKQDHSLNLEEFIHAYINFKFSVLT